MNDTRKDIESRDDLEKMLSAFYAKAFVDEKIGRFFIEVVPLDLTTHLPVITDFWESIIFGTKGYGKNVMAIHQHIHELSPIKKEHLEQWVYIFTTTVDEMFLGKNAEMAKLRARSIASLMDLRLNHNSLNKLS